MCSIYGWMGTVPIDVKISILEGADERGRDGWGVRHDGKEVRSIKEKITQHDKYHEILCSWQLVGNHRATPTTEVESIEENLQPYSGIVHNGTIANDKELWDSFKMEHKAVDSMVLPDLFLDTYRKAGMIGLTLDLFEMKNAVQRIKGSFAIAMAQPDTIMLACNYKPIYIKRFDLGFAFASTPEMLDCDAVPMEPYSLMEYDARRNEYDVQHMDRVQNKRVAVSASSGLDSTVVAYMLKAKGYEVDLVHFTYGCLAQDAETVEIKKIAEHGGFRLNFVDMPRVMGGSIVEGKYHQAGVAGSEYAHDWVSARNLLMLSILTAYAETAGIGYIAFGGNLEEAGSYPDNEQEFGRRFNAILPFATQNGVKIELLQPVATFMKHEIVKEGRLVGAPFELTWSCYGNQLFHCGKCGPCFMRRTAFERNGIVDPVIYLDDQRG